MRLRALPVLLVLLLLAVPAAMLVYVSTLDPSGDVDPAPTGPRRAPRSAADTAPPSPKGAFAPAAEPDRPRPATSRSEEADGVDRIPVAPPVDGRYAAAVTGRVVGLGGASLEGVKVLAIRGWFSRVGRLNSTPIGGASRYQRAALGETDAAGRFTLRGLDPDLHHYLVLRHARHATRVHVVLPFGFPGPARVGDLWLESGSTVTGVCRDREGRPLAGVEVTGRSLDSGPIFEAEIPGLIPTAKSAADGRYRLEKVPSGRLRVVGTAPDGRRAVQMPGLVVPGRRIAGVDLTLSQGLPIAGRVVDTDGRGLPGVRVEVNFFRGKGGAAIIGPRVCTTDAQGRFGFVAATESVWQVAASRRGLRTEGIRAPTGMEDIRLVLVSARVFTVRGTVVELGTGEPIEGAHLVLVGIPGRSRGAVGGDDGAVSSADGGFELEVAEQDRPCTVVAMAEGYVSDRSAPIALHEKAKDPPPLRMHLERAARLSGRVTRQGGGGAVAGAVVYVYRARDADPQRLRAVGRSMTGGAPAVARACTDADGAFAIGDIASGQYVLTTQAAGFAPTLLAGVKLAAGVARDDLSLVLGIGGSFHGMIRYPDGSPVKGHEIALRGPVGREHRTPTDGDGRFAFDHLPTGRFGVQLIKPGRGQSRTWHGGEARPEWYARDTTLEEVTIVQGGHVERMITLERGVRVHGFVRTLGLPRADCAVELKPLGRETRAPGSPAAFARPRWVRTDKNGAYVVPDVPPGNARITVRVSNTSQAVVALEREIVVPRRTDWPLDLDLPGGGIRGRVLLPPGVDREMGRPRLEITDEAQPGLRRQVFTQIDGTFVFDLLLPGDYRLHVFADELWGAVDRRLTVAPNVVLAGLEISLVTGVKVSGVVVTEDGEPCELAQMTVRPAGRDDGRGRGVIELRSGPYGKFKIPAIQPGRYTFFAQKAARQSSSVEITVPPSGRDDIRLVVKPVRR